jgi:fluoride ion exporter CrcB/FEX
MITKYLLIGLGGGLGAISRAVVSSMLPATILASFPF